LDFYNANLEIEARLADKVIGKVLNVDAGFPILYRRSQMSVEDYGCVLTGESFHRGDMYKYTSRLNA
jgi:DNA-binding GntR family transcriptional regulator